MFSIIIIINRRILPVPLTMIPFGVIAQQYKIVEKANNCSCWYKWAVFVIFLTFSMFV